MNCNSDGDMDALKKNNLKKNIQFPKMDPPPRKLNGFEQFRIHDAFSDTMHHRNKGQNLIWHMDNEDNMNNSFDMKIEEDTPNKERFRIKNIFESEESFRKDDLLNFDLDSFLDLN